MTLSDKKEAQQIWASTIGQEAIYRHSYLAHCVLAVSALHLSQTSNISTSEIQNYRSLGIYHQNAALSLPRPQLAAINADNCDALLASAMLTFFFTVAFPRPADKSMLLDDIVELSSLAKGVYTVSERARRVLGKGPLRDLRSFRPWDTPDSLLPENVSQRLHRIRCMVNMLSSDEGREIYLSAIGMLEQMLAALTANPFRPAFIFMWLVQVDRKFMDLIRSRDPIALHISAIMGFVRSRWRIGGGQRIGGVIL